MSRTKLLVLLLVALVIALFFWFDLDRFLALDMLRARQQQLTRFVAGHPLLAGSVFFFSYVVIAALSIPGAAIMTLAAGAVFGLVAGTVLVSFASSIGATLAFLLARFLFREPVERRLGETARRLNEGIQRDGAYYLFSLRLVPLFPFFVINLAMGLTRLDTVTFYWVSQLGMLAGTIVYVNAGTRLAGIETAADVLSPGLVASFILLGIFPLLARKSLELLRRVRHR